MSDATVDAGDVGRLVCARQADADGVAFPSDSWVSDVNVVASDGEIAAGLIAEGDVVAARRVRVERTRRRWPVL